MLTITPTDNQSFKAVNVVRVSQQAFKNPADIKACGREVDRALGGSGNTLATIWMAIKNVFGIKPKEKIMTDVIGEFKDATQKEGFHTFSVITGADAEECLEKATLKNVMAFMKEYGITDSKEAMESIQNKVKWAMNCKPSKEITVNTLDELRTYADKI